MEHNHITYIKLCDLTFFRTNGEHLILHNVVSNIAMITDICLAIERINSQAIHHLYVRGTRYIMPYASIEDTNINLKHLISQHIKAQYKDAVLSLIYSKDIANINLAHETQQTWLI